jgi:pimeloyl-ACP methyl ester carboxylesterase
VRGIELAYDDTGHGEAIFFFHGYPFNRSMWREQLAFFGARGYRVIAPDLRGLGETMVSTSAGEGINEHGLKSVSVTTMEDMARDAAALMDGLNVGRATVCGLSMGSYVALDFVHLFPARVRALVLAGARAQAADEQEKQSRGEQAQRVPAEGMKFVADAMLPKLLAPRTRVEEPDVVRAVREMILRTDPTGAAAAQRGMAGRHDHSRRLSEINVPTLIVAGAEDTIRAPEDADFLNKRIPDSKLEIIKEAAHLMNMDQPEQFNDILLRFLELTH